MRVMWAVTGSTRASVSPAVWLTKEVWTFSIASMTCGSCNTCTATKCVGLHVACQHVLIMLSWVSFSHFILVSHVAWRFQRYDAQQLKTRL
jgi:hypothetical protein